MPKKLLSLCGISALILLTSTACAKGSVAASEISTPARGESAEKMIDAFAGTTYDYDPELSTEALAKISDVVISGNVAGVQKGRTEVAKGSEKLIGTTSILIIKSATPVSGASKNSNATTFYVEMPSATGDPSVAEAFPAGTEVVAYLYEASDGLPSATSDTYMLDPLGGRPAGEPLYIFVSPQGFIAEAEDGKTLVWPIGEGVTEEGSLSEALPGGSLIAQP